jgi:hypothetical protein
LPVQILLRAPLIRKGVRVRIKKDAFPKDFEPAVNWVSGLIGAAVDKRVTGYEARERKNPLLTAHFREHFALEFALARTRKRRKTVGHLPTGDEYAFLYYGFLVPAHRIHAALPQEVRTAFEGRLRNAVTGAHGFRPFAYEISIATHLMHKGWDVDFTDYSGAGRFDLLARRGAVEIEVECKSTSGDTGRKIHRQEVNRLADLLLPTTEQLADTRGCHRILVTLPDRLGKSDEDLSAITSIVASAVQQKNTASNGLARAEYVFDDLASWPEPGRDPKAKSFFERRFGIHNAHLLFHSRPNEAVIAVMIRSDKADTVVNAIAEAAKEAADQCSGTRPALIALHLIDEISRPELHAMLTAPNGFHAVAQSVFEGGKRQHVDSIAFTVPQSIRAVGAGTKLLSGPVSVLNNPHPLFRGEEVRSVFRAP